MNRCPALELHEQETISDMRNKQCEVSLRRLWLRLPYVLQVGFEHMHVVTRWGLLYVRRKAQI